MYMLHDHKTVIGWTLADIKGMNHFTCIFCILLEENSKSTREMQRCLNSSMIEVVKVETLKLLDFRVIYPILDSMWVCLIHEVPKKLGIIIV